MKSKDAQRFVALAMAGATRDHVFVAAMMAHNPVPLTVEEFRGCVDAGMRATGQRQEQMFVWLGRSPKSMLRKIVGYDLQNRPIPELQPGERVAPNPTNGRPTIYRDAPDAHP